MPEPEPRKRKRDECRFCPFLGISQLQNQNIILTYPDIKKKKDEIPDDIETKEKFVREDLLKHGITINTFSHEVDQDGKRWWSCPESNCVEKFHSPEQVRSHLFHKNGISQKQIQEKIFKYNLGNEIFTNDPDVAMNLFADREFPEIVNYKTQPHNITFVPNNYLFGSVTTQVITKKAGRRGLQKAKQEKLNKHNGDLDGKEIEEFFFKKLKKTLEMIGVKNAVVISGWKVQGTKRDPSREFDFIIVSNDSKTIFHVEVKKTYFNDTNAFEQVQNGFEFFNKTIPFLPISPWKYSKSVYFHEGWDASENKPCTSCTHHILEPTTNLSEWWTNITTSKEAPNLQQDDPTYLTMMKYIFHQMYQQGDCITPSDELKLAEENIETMSTVENIFFWSRTQYDLLQEAKETKKIAFLSQFGTGKTSLLKERALRLLKKGEKVVFIIFQNEHIDEETLLMSIFKRGFQDFSDRAKFHQICSLDSGAGGEVDQIVQENPVAHFFFDEVLAGVDGFPTEKLNELASGMPEDSYFWIACQSENAPNKEFLGEFFVPCMDLPLRYCGNNLELNTRMKNIFGETSFPSEEVNPKLFLNQGPPSLFLALKPNVHLACAVEQLAFILDKEERTTTLIKIDFEKETIIPALKTSIIKNRLIFKDGDSQTYKDFLEPINNKKILVVSSIDNSLIRGFEVPVLVHFTSRISGQQIQDIYSRCKSKLIIICNECEALKVVPSNAKTDSAGIIQVHDELMPERFEEAIKSSDKQKLVNFLKDKRGRKVPVESRNKASQTGLMIACTYASSDIVQEFLNRNADVNAIDANHWSPIHFAADRGDLKIFKKIFSCFQHLPEQHLVTKKTNNGATPLHLASGKGHLSVVKKLAATNLFKLNEKATYGSTPLHLASNNQHLHVVKYLVLECGASVNMKYDGLTPLHFASSNDHLEVVKCLVEECEANVNIKSNGGWTPLHFASSKGLLGVVKFLVGKGGANVNIKRNNGDTPLHFATENGHIDVVKYLVLKGKANINLMNYLGQKPVDKAWHYDIKYFLAN